MVVAVRTGWGAGIGLGVSGPEWAAQMENLGNLTGVLDGTAETYDPADYELADTTYTVANNPVLPGAGGASSRHASTVTPARSNSATYTGGGPLDNNLDLVTRLLSGERDVALASAMAFATPYHSEELRLFIDCHVALAAKPVNAERLDDLLGVLEDKLSSSPTSLSEADRITLLSAQVALMRARANLLSGEDQRELRLAANQLAKSFRTTYGYDLPDFKSGG